MRERTVTQIPALTVRSLRVRPVALTPDQPVQTAAGTITQTCLVLISAHLLAASPAAGWLEYIDHAGPLLAEPVAARGGYVTAAQQHGSGISWDELAVDRAAC